MTELPNAPDKDDRACLLIAMPQLSDPFFIQTTTLLTEFTSNGAMGVVLNRKLDIKVKDMIDTSEAQSAKLPGDIAPYWGGPVQPERGFLIHEAKEFEKESVKITDDLFITGSLEILQKLSSQKDPIQNRYRLFLGYAGWGPGQLESEISQASWVTAPIDQNFIFDDKVESLWNRSLQKIGVDPMRLASSPSEQAH